MRKIFYLILLLLLNACQGLTNADLSSNELTLQASTATPLPTSTIIEGTLSPLPSTGSPLPSATFMKDTPTPLPSATPFLVSQYSRITYNCVEFLDHIPEDVELPGVLVFTHYLLNLETGGEIQLGEDLRFYEISPDGEVYAVSEEMNEVQLFDSTGKEIDNIYVPGEDWLKPAYWINPKSLVLFKAIQMDYGSGFGVYSDYSAILNIDTGNLVEIPKETFPDFHPREIGDRWNITRSVISSDGRYIVYATTVDMVSDYIVLWDLENSTEVARFDGLRDSSAPQWTPNGKSFLTSLNWAPFAGEDDLPYVGGNELVRINTAGEVERLTHMTMDYKAGQWSFVWSPTGDKVAFWMGTDFIYDESQLAILDLSNGSVTNYCVQGEDEPIWSPNGKYLTLSISLQDDENYNDVVIVDIEDGVMYLVKENAGWLLGWMNVAK